MGACTRTKGGNAVENRDENKKANTRGVGLDEEVLAS